MSSENKIEYVELNDEEIWQINYDEGYAIDIDRKENINRVLCENRIKYAGSIDQFLKEERGCKDIHFHESIAFPRRIQIQNKALTNKNSRCTFRR